MTRLRAPRARPPVAVTLSVLAVAVLCAACGRSTEDSSATAAIGERTLRRGLGAEPETLDPRLAYDNAALAVVGDLYEGLTIETRDGSIAPGAAAGWTVAPDGLAYAFTLRDGLRWSNGDPLTAGHFAAGLRAAGGPGSTTPGAALLEAIAAVDAPDERTLRIHLHRPLPYLPALLAMPMAAPLQPAATKSGAALVNGPYRLLRRLPGERVELERNPHYHAAASIAINRVDYLPIADLATELKLYRAGALDLTSQVPNAQLQFLRETLPNELRLTPYLSVNAYAVNLARLVDRDVRMALAMAVDRRRITRQVTGAGEQPALGWIPDGFPGYTAARFEWRELPYAETAARASQLWDTARRAGTAPARLTLCTDASDNHRRTAVALADLWSTVLGVETTIVEFEWRVFLDRRHHPGDCDLMRLGWSADFLDPEAFATVFESGGTQNTLGYASAAYDDLLQQSRLEADPSRRMALLARAEARLLDDVPVIPIFFTVSKRLVNPELQGVGANPLDHIASRDLSFTP